MGGEVWQRLDLPIKRARDISDRPFGGLWIPVKPGADAGAIRLLPPVGWRAESTAVEDRTGRGVAKVLPGLPPLTAAQVRARVRVERASRSPRDSRGTQCCVGD